MVGTTTAQNPDRGGANLLVREYRCAMMVARELNCDASILLGRDESDPSGPALKRNGVPTAAHHSTRKTDGHDRQIGRATLLNLPENFKCVPLLYRATATTIPGVPS